MDNKTKRDESLAISTNQSQNITLETVVDLNRRHILQVKNKAPASNSSLPTILGARASEDPSGSARPISAITRKAVQVAPSPLGRPESAKFSRNSEVGELPQKLIHKSKSMDLSEHHKAALPSILSFQNGALDNKATAPDQQKSVAAKDNSKAEATTPDKMPPAPYNEELDIVEDDGQGEFFGEDDVNKGDVATNSTVNTEAIKITKYVIDEMIDGQGVGESASDKIARLQGLVAGALSKEVTADSFLKYFTAKPEVVNKNIKLEDGIGDEYLQELHGLVVKQITDLQKMNRQATDGANASESDHDDYLSDQDEPKTPENSRYQLAKLRRELAESRQSLNTIFDLDFERAEREEQLMQSLTNAQREAGQVIEKLKKEKEELATELKFLKVETPIKKQAPSVKKELVPDEAVSVEMLRRIEELEEELRREQKGNGEKLLQKIQEFETAVNQLNLFNNLEKEDLRIEFKKQESLLNERIEELTQAISELKDSAAEKRSEHEDNEALFGQIESVEEEKKKLQLSVGKLLFAQAKSVGSFDLGEGDAKISINEKLAGGGVDDKKYDIIFTKDGQEVTCTVNLEGEASFGEAIIIANESSDYLLGALQAVHNAAQYKLKLAQEAKPAIVVAAPQAPSLAASVIASAAGPKKDDIDREMLASLSTIYDCYEAESDDEKMKSNIEINHSLQDDIGKNNVKITIKPGKKFEIEFSSSIVAEVMNGVAARDDDDENAVFSRLKTIVPKQLIYSISADDVGTCSSAGEDVANKTLLTQYADEARIIAAKVLEVEALKIINALQERVALKDKGEADAVGTREKLAAERIFDRLVSHKELVVEEGYNVEYVEYVEYEGGDDLLADGSADAGDNDAYEGKFIITIDNKKYSVTKNKVTLLSGQAEIVEVQGGSEVEWSDISKGNLLRSNLGVDESVGSARVVERAVDEILGRVNKDLRENNVILANALRERPAKADGESLDFSLRRSLDDNASCDLEAELSDTVEVERLAKISKAKENFALMSAFGELRKDSESPKSNGALSGGDHFHLRNKGDKQLLTFSHASEFFTYSVDGEGGEKFYKGENDDGVEIALDTSLSEDSMNVEALEDALPAALAKAADFQKATVERLRGNRDKAREEVGKLSAQVKSLELAKNAETKAKNKALFARMGAIGALLNDSNGVDALLVRQLESNKDRFDLKTENGEGERSLTFSQGNGFFTYSVNNEGDAKCYKSYLAQDGQGNTVEIDENINEAIHETLLVAQDAKRSKEKAAEQKKRDESDAEMARLREELEALKASLLQKDQAMASLKEEKAQLEGDNETLNEALSALVAEKDQTVSAEKLREALVENLQAQLAVSKKDNESLVNQLEQSGRDKDGLKGANDALQQRNVDLNRQLEEMKAQFEAQRLEIDELRAAAQAIPAPAEAARPLAEDDEKAIVEAIQFLYPKLKDKQAAIKDYKAAEMTVDEGNPQLKREYEKALSAEKAKIAEFANKLKAYVAECDGFDMSIDDDGNPSEEGVSAILNLLSGKIENIDSIKDNPRRLFLVGKSKIDRLDRDGQLNARFDVRMASEISVRLRPTNPTLFGQLDGVIKKLVASIGYDDSLTVESFRGACEKAGFTENLYIDLINAVEKFNKGCIATTDSIAALTFFDKRQGEGDRVMPECDRSLLRVDDFVSAVKAASLVGENESVTAIMAISQSDDGDLDDGVTAIKSLVTNALKDCLTRKDDPDFKKLIGEGEKHRKDVAADAPRPPSAAAKKPVAIALDLGKNFRRDFVGAGQAL